MQLKEDIKKKYPLPEGVYEKKPGRFSSALKGTMFGALSIAMPLSTDAIGKDKNLILRLGIDIIGNVIALNLGREVDVQAGFIAKFGYNLLVQIAPDVAKLAKDKVFRRVK